MLINNRVERILRRGGLQVEDKVNYKLKKKTLQVSRTCDRTETSVNTY